MQSLQTEERGVWESSVPFFFIMFAVNVSTECHFRCVRAYLTLMQLLFETGNVSKEHLENNRRILCSFLMSLDFSNNDLQQQNAAPGGTADNKNELEFYNDNDNNEDDKIISNYRMAIKLAMPE
jgi:hypothetical protein